jgi:hypothetical protein
LKNNHENEKINEKIKKMFSFKNNENVAFIPTKASNNVDMNNGLSSEVFIYIYIHMYICI